MLPSIPNAGTADPNPLVRLADYQRITKDTTTSTDDFEAALADALDDLQREMRRTFLYAQYTERLFLFRNGQVYPTATPLDPSKPVSAPAQETTQNVGIFQGDGIWVGWFIPLPSLPVWQGVVPPQTDITYYGGWVGPDSTLYGQRPIPSKLVRIICRVVWFICNPIALTGMPGGVKSVSIGGVSMSGDLSSFMDADPQLRRDIKRWRKAQVIAWDAQVTT